MGYFVFCFVQLSVSELCWVNRSLNAEVQLAYQQFCKPLEECECLRLNCVFKSAVSVHYVLTIQPFYSLVNFPIMFAIRTSFVSEVSIQHLVSYDMPLRGLKCDRQLQSI